MDRPHPVDPNLPIGWMHQLLLNGPTRLCYVDRFSGCHVGHRENVAEHSWLVAVYAMMLAHWCRDTGAVDHSELDVGDVVQRALLHDAEEATSGDFPRPFKYSSPQLKEMLDSAAEDAFDLTFQGCASPALAHHLKYVWTTAKNPREKAGLIVRFCDFLSVVGYAMREGAGGNAMLRQHLGTLNTYALGFNALEYDFIRPWVAEAQCMVREIMT